MEKKGEILFGELKTCNFPDINNRVYSVRVLKQALKKFNVHKKFRAGELVLTYPSNFSETATDLHKISHRILNIKRRGNKFFASARILKSFNGRVLNEINVKDFKFCLRGIGNVEYKNGHNYITNLEILAIDICPNI